jgi:hypothetical protein
VIERCVETARTTTAHARNTSGAARSRRQSTVAAIAPSTVATTSSARSNDVSIGPSTSGGRQKAIISVRQLEIATTTVATT